MRSRILNAEEFIKSFNKSSLEESTQLLLKSTILLTVNKFSLKGSFDAYTCDLNIRPSIGRITPNDQQRIAFGSAYTAIESSIKNDDYTQLVDKYFDSVAIIYLDKNTEFMAPESTEELLNIAKKIVLGDNYKDTFVDQEN
jgi:hypothetical protein